MRKERWHWIGRAVVGAALLVTALPATAEITDDQAAAELVGVVAAVGDPQVQTRRFDPKGPPPDMPKLKDGEAAVTSSGFGCSALVSVLIINQEESGGRATATVRISGIKLTTTLLITMWLPHKATTKLTAHEQAHRQIDEIFYKDAAAAIQRIGGPLLGREFTASGDDGREALDAAMKQAANDACGQYMRSIQQPAAAAQVRFDELTDHGRNKVPEARAIRQAVAEARKATTAPTP